MLGKERRLQIILVLHKPSPANMMMVFISIKEALLPNYGGIRKIGRFLMICWPL